MKVSEESPRWQWPQAAFAMHRIEEGLHLLSFGNVKTVLCIPIQGRVRETLDMCSLGTCFSWLPATGVCLAMGTLSANLSPSPIFVFVHCSAGAWHKRTGRAYGTVRDYWLLFLASIVVPQPLSSYAGVTEGGGAGMDSKEGHSTRPIRERRFEDRKGRLHRRPKGKKEHCAHSASWPYGNMRFPAAFGTVPPPSSFSIPSLFPCIGKRGIPSRRNVGITKRPLSVLSRRKVKAPISSHRL